ncbi:DinB family protein [Leeuwenhoekiella sp. W20_SRS_FM14]|uniref:DinB family protein n=1 Tax=Leeuwenhoekiella sp. W20_SRS_FM14 TaxID=3240270 RepID=UPI003F95F71C
MSIKNFNDTIDVWIKELSRFNIEQLKIKPDERSWSLGQLYEHLIEETNWYNGQIEMTLGNEKNIDKETSDAAKSLLKRGSFKNKRFRGDPLISEKVKQPTETAKLKSELERLKKTTNEIWAKMDNTSNYGKSEHPGIGFLNGFEWIQYSEMHMRHHLKQKERIENFLQSLQ